MKNMGHIYVDNEYPESEDYESNFIDYKQDESGSSKKAMKDARTQLRIEKLNSSELPSPGTSGLRFARLEKNSFSQLGQDLSEALKLLTRLLNTWHPQQQGHISG